MERGIMLKDATHQLSALPRPVQLWMRWLNVVFLPAFQFASDFEPARWALAAYLAAFPIGALVFAFTRNIHMTGLPHILLWAPLLAYFPYSVVSNPATRLFSFYTAWVLVLSITIAISVYFDIRALIDFVGPKVVTKINRYT